MVIQQRCPPEVWSDKPPYPLPLFVAQNYGAEPIISPGVFNPLPNWNGVPLLACEWQSWAMALPVGQELQAMTLIYETGLKDGLSWADANGHLG